MIREPNYNQISIEEFKTPFERGLDKSNRWVVLSNLLPWEKLSRIYTRALNKNTGRPALPARVAIGAVIIKHKMRLPDEEVIPAIQENPYLQYFLGYSEFSHKRPFDPSLCVTIRKRLGAEAFNEMIDSVLTAVAEVEKKTKYSRKKKTGKKKPPPPSVSSGEKQESEPEPKDKRSGTLLVDASVAPADIKYPTDLDLLNTSREHSEKLIDRLWQDAKSPGATKPRTYRRLARKDYLSLSKKRKKGAKALRKGLRKQLNYLHRNIKTINRLLDDSVQKEWPLSYQDQRQFWIIQEVYRQQKQMYKTYQRKISDRIVSVSQPHVRPIVRGKAGRDVEFGAKLSGSVVDGYVFLDRLSWDAYHEASDLSDQVEKYRKRFGFYPEAVVGDNIYGTRSNRAWLKEKRIRFSGRRLGRPPKETVENSEQLKFEKKRLALEARL